MGGVFGPVRSGVAGPRSQALPPIDWGELTRYCEISGVRLEEREFTDALGRVNRVRGVSFVATATRDALMLPVFSAHMYDRDDIPTRYGRPLMNLLTFEPDYNAGPPGWVRGMRTRGFFLFMEDPYVARIRIQADL
jgi:hypothetical protein